MLFSHAAVQSIRSPSSLPAGGGFATSNKTVAVSMSLSLNLVKSMPYIFASGGQR